MELYRISSNTFKEEFLKWLAIGAGLTVTRACVGAIIAKYNQDKQKNSLAISAE